MDWSRSIKTILSKWIRYFCDNSKFHPQNSHYVHTEQKTCKVSNCPQCFESWVNRQANRSTRRMEKFLEIQIDNTSLDILYYRQTHKKQSQ